MTFQSYSLSGGQVIGLVPTFDPKDGTGQYKCTVYEVGKSEISPNSVTLNVDVYTLSIRKCIIFYLSLFLSAFSCIAYETLGVIR